MLTPRVTHRGSSRCNINNQALAENKRKKNVAAAAHAAVAAAITVMGAVNVCISGLVTVSTLGCAVADVEVRGVRNGLFGGVLRWCGEIAW